MQERLLDKIAEPFNIQLPVSSSMDAAIDSILPAIQGKSQSLKDEEYFLNRQWIKLSDDIGSTAVQLYIFQSGGRIFISNDGKVENGSWNVLDGTQKMIIGAGSMGGILYNLTFLDADFFILKQHGSLKGVKSKYLVFANERIAGRMEWDQSLEMLADKYRNTNVGFLVVALVLVLLVIGFLVLSRGG